MEIGRIVKSNSHVDYVCQVWAAGEVDGAPSRSDHAFGTLVAVDLTETGSALVGVIYDTILHNPEFGMAGPRFLPPVDSGILAPDRLAETATLAGILALGTLGPGGAYHGVPPTTPAVGARVRVLGDDEFRDFHRPNGQFAVGYTSHVLGHRAPLVGPLLLVLSERIEALFPEEAAAIRVVKGNLAWRLKVEQAQ